MINQTILFLQIFLLLLLSHLLGDFVFQTDQVVEKKRKKLIWLGIHSAIPSIIAFCLLANGQLWFIPLIMLITHAAIDFSKSKLESGKNPFLLFVIDQFLHIIVLFFLSIWAISVSPVLPRWIIGCGAIFWRIVVFLCAFVSLTWVGGYAIKYFMESIQPKPIDSASQQNAVTGIIPDGLQNGGKYIGYLERLLIFIFVWYGQYTALGFLVAAKSILRLPEINKQEGNRATAEYIIIGTMASFLFGILVTLFFKKIYLLIK